MDATRLGLPATLISRYEPRACLGAGGMGEVWSAWDKLAQRDVAIKLLRHDRRPEEGRLVEEFALISSLDHPGIMRVYDVGLAGETLYMVSALVTGERLDRQLRKGIEGAEVLHLLSELLTTLSWLHDEGIVHADLKPANIVLVKEGAHTWPILLDFGLSHAAGYPKPPTGGTPAYMAPELKTGFLPSPQTDLYALGKCFEKVIEQADTTTQKLIKSLCALKADDRPQSARHALRTLSDSGASSHRLGGGSIHALWGDAAEGFAQGLKTKHAHRELVRLPTAEDAPAFLAAVKVHLELAGQRTLSTPAESHGRLWSQLLTSMDAENPLGTQEETPPLPEDQREVLDAEAVAIIQALRRVRHPPVLMIPRPEEWGPADRFILARVVEAEAIPSIVLATGPSTSLGLTPAAEAGLSLTSIPTPDDAHLKRFLASHRVSTEPPSEVWTLLTARARAGAAQLRRLLDVWVDASLLVADDAGEWTWNDEVDPRVVDTEDLDQIWRALWSHLSADEQEAIHLARALGSVATLQELLHLSQLTPIALRKLIETLAGQGWLIADSTHRYRVPSALNQRFSEHILPPKVVTATTRQRILALLSKPEPWWPLTRQKALAQYFDEDSQSDQAATLWSQIATRYETMRDPANAGHAALRAAKSEHAGHGSNPQILTWTERAVKLLERGGDDAALDEALALVRDIQATDRTAETSLSCALIEARVALERTQAEACLRHIEHAESALENTGGTFRTRFDLALMRGTAFSHLNRLGEAQDALQIADQEARLIEDDVAVGRVGNNLGIVAYRRGDFMAAAEAWENTRLAKAKASDLRGQRIAVSNRGLALRESGALGPATKCAVEALRLASETGDLRGRTTAHMSLAQLWLDIDRPIEAQTHLDAINALGIASELVKADLTLLKIRSLLAQGNFEKAASMSQDLFQDAASKNLATITPEAWCLGYLANMEKHVLSQTSTEEAKTLIESAKNPSIALKACLSHAWSQAGNFAAAHKLLTPLVASLQENPRPSDHLAIEPLLRVACIVDDQDAIDTLEEALAGVEQARRKWRNTIMETAGPLTAQFAKPGHIIETTQQESAHFMQEEPGTEETLLAQISTPSNHAYLTMLNTLEQTDIRQMSPWARALCDAAQASACEIYGFDLQDGEPVQMTASTRPKGRRPRWSEPAARVRLSQDGFVARSDNDQLAACGLPLTIDGEKAVGTVFFDWATGTSLSPDELEKQLQTGLALAALALDRQRTMQSNQALRAELEMLKATHERLIAEHETEMNSVLEALHQSRSEIGLRFGYENIVHQSQGMRRVLRTLDKVTDPDLSVLVLGESGVGKELVARAVHFNGPRRDKPFVAENCGAIPHDLFESTFFGHVRGAFSGAHSNQKGRIEAAHGGTLFLDEVGELRPEHQVKLLRVLQEKRFRPVGSVREIEADFRLVAATNRDLLERVKAGKFREDLYYRLAVVTVEIPPLRERPEDIVPLAQRFLDNQAEREGRTLQLAPDAAGALLAYEWPGNVRELENEILRASIVTDSDTVRAGHLSPKVHGNAGSRQGDGGLGRLWDGQSPLEHVIGAVERRIIIQALEANRGQKAPTARQLGISRPGLDGKIARYQIDASAIRREAKQKRMGRQS